MDDRIGEIVISTPMVKALFEDGSEKESHLPEMKYSKHFVCYIDLLGVRQGVEDIVQQRKIFTALNMYKKIKASYETNHNIRIGIMMDSKVESKTELTLPYQCSFFSDCLVLSYKHDNPRRDFADLYCILCDINLLTYMFLRKGIFIRGGFSYGDLYHEGDVCFGRALADAVELEEDVAKHPRIAIAPNIFDPNSDEFPYKNMDVDLNGSAWRMFFNYKIGTDFSEEPHVQFCDFLDDRLSSSVDGAIEIRNNIVKELLSPHPERIMEKYEWMKEYYNGTLGRAFQPNLSSALEI